MNRWATINIQTATKTAGSMCQLALVMFDTDGNYLRDESLVWYIRPPGDIYDSAFTDMHGLNSETTKHAKHWHDVVPDIASLVGNNIRLVAHKADFVYQNLFAASQNGHFWHPTSQQMACSLFLSRFSLPQLRNHRLQDVASHLSLNTNFQRETPIAFQKAWLCGQIWIRLTECKNIPLSGSFAFHDAIPSEDVKGSKRQQQFLEQLVKESIPRPHIVGDEANNLIIIGGVLSGASCGVPDSDEEKIQIWTQNLSEETISKLIPEYISNTPPEPPTLKQKNFLRQLLQKRRNEYSHLSSVIPQEDILGIRYKITIVGISITTGSLRDSNPETLWLDNLDRKQARAAIQKLLDAPDPSHN